MRRRTGGRRGQARILREGFPRPRFPQPRPAAVPDRSRIAFVLAVTTCAKGAEAILQQSKRALAHDPVSNLFLHKRHANAAGGSTAASSGGDGQAGEARLR
jgi:hypothetical protein